VKIYFLHPEYYVDLDGAAGLLGPFGSIAEITAKWPAEFAAAYPDGLNVGQGGNVSHRISVQGVESFSEV
jgi:hypothetical protein